ncbi:MarR family transcriptional regulator [Saccharopolyspora oryzae]|uniref:MarR family transcriptional regulator n=1 Tax=Saccharopolyspora oryzae TaxID=2997343 RepID=A0ABT4UV19_9PSEU|nr:MarR family transcriptional regulator [Saccharopolyspora oryzae]MDA3625565.1 MarR family transcriptional regulator [Saccharopolyspora oryzae]
MGEARRSEKKDQDPDIGILTARLLHGVQRTLFGRLADEGFDDLRPQHGAVLAYLDEDGSRAVDLSRRSGVHKQVVSKLLDELEQLGYVNREPDPRDRRAKLIVPTPRGLAQMERSDAIMGDLERDLRNVLDAERFDTFKADLLRCQAALGR